MAGLGFAGRSHQYHSLLTFNKVDSANINEKYAMKVANDMPIKRFIRQKGSSCASVRTESKNTKTESDCPSKTNVP